MSHGVPQWSPILNLTSVVVWMATLCAIENQVKYIQSADRTLLQLRLLLADRSFHPVAEDVPAEDMALLNASGVIRGDAERKVSDQGCFAAALPSKRNCECTDLPRRSEGGTDVLA